MIKYNSKLLEKLLTEADIVPDQELDLNPDMEQGKEANDNTAKLRAVNDSDSKTQLEDKQDIVRKYIANMFNIPEAQIATSKIMQDIEPLIPSLTASAEEVGLDQNDLPLLAWVRNYYSKPNYQPLTAQEYLKLHNLYATDDDIKPEFVAGIPTEEYPEGKDNILYKYPLYKYNGDEFKRIAQEYFETFSPNNADNIKVNNKSVKIGNKTINIDKLREKNVNETAKLRDATFFRGQDGNLTINPYAVIQKVANALYSNAGGRSANEFARFVTFVKDLGYDLSEDKNKALVSWAILKQFSANINNPGQMEEYVLNKYRNAFGDKYYQGRDKTADNLKKILSDNVEVASDVGKLMAAFSNNSTVINTQNAEKLLKQINGLAKVNTNKAAAKNVARTPREKAANDKHAFDRLLKWCQDRIDNTHGNQNNVWRYMIQALADLKPRGGSAISDQNNEKDAEIYNRYVKDNIINKNFNNERYNFFLNCEPFRKANKKVRQELIKYLASTNSVLK